MTTFAYTTNNGIETTTEAFGEICKAAKAWAAEHHTYLSREVTKNGETRTEYYVNAGCFLPEGCAKPDQIKIW